MIGIKERREELRVCLMNVDFSPEDLESSASGKLTYFTEKALSKLLLELHNLGLVFKVEGELPGCPYDSLIFPTTIKEAGQFLTAKGLTDREKTAVSGTIARLGWENCVQAIKEAGYTKTEPMEEGK